MGQSETRQAVLYEPDDIPIDFRYYLFEIIQ